MKKLLLTLASLGMLVAAAGCTKLLTRYSRAFGADIVFGSSRSGGSNTRVAYSGFVGSDKYERIDWLEGDKLRIWCSEASEPACHYADYLVSVGTVTSDGRSSSAKIELEQGKIGLRWGEPGTTHHFSSLCPAPGSGVEGTSVGEGSVTCVLPSLQTFSDKLILPAAAGGDSVVFAPNPNYIYLAGYAEAEAAQEGGEGEGEAINIYYDPAITTFEFILHNNYESQSVMTVKQVGITTSKGDNVLSGTYTVDVRGISLKDSLDTGAIGDITGGSPTLSMEFKDPVTVPYGKTITFTLFAHPKYDITNLTFWFYDSEGCKRSFGFKYADKSWVKFTAFHKSVLKGILAKESAGWTINTIPMVTAWNPNDVRDIDVEYGAGLTFKTPAVVEWTNSESGDVNVILKDKKSL